MPSLSNAADAGLAVCPAPQGGGWEENPLRGALAALALLRLASEAALAGHTRVPDTDRIA